MGLGVELQNKFIAGGLETAEDVSGMIPEEVVKLGKLTSKIELNVVHKCLKAFDGVGLEEFDEEKDLSRKIKSMFVRHGGTKVTSGYIREKTHAVDVSNPIDPDELAANIKLYEDALDGDTAGLEKKNAQRMGMLATLHDVLTRGFIERGGIDLKVMVIDPKTEKETVKGFTTPTGNFKAWEFIGRQLGFGTKAMVLSPEAEGKKRGQVAESAVDDIASANTEMDKIKNEAKASKTLPFSAKSG